MELYRDKIIAMRVFPAATTATEIMIMLRTEIETIEMLMMKLLTTIVRLLNND